MKEYVKLLGWIALSSVWITLIGVLFKLEPGAKLGLGCVNGFIIAMMHMYHKEIRK